MQTLQKPIQGVFLDVGWTLLYPPSGNWQLTPLIMEYVSPEHQNKYGWDQINAAQDAATERVLTNDHLVKDEAHEFRQFYDFYTALFDSLPELNISSSDIKRFAEDKVYNDDIYTFFSDTRLTVETLKKRGYKLGIISDTWPSLRRIMRHFGILDYFDFITFSCDLGVFKPHQSMFLHALDGLNLPADNTIFVDDLLPNVLAAAEHKIQPVLITKSPATRPDKRVTNIMEISDLLTLLD